MLIGGVLKIFDQAPEGFESFVDVLRASTLLGGRREIKLDRDSIGSEHDCGSSSLGCVPGRRHPGTYLMRRTFLKPDPSEDRALNH